MKHQKASNETPEETLARLMAPPDPSETPEELEARANECMKLAAERKAHAEELRQYVATRRWKVIQGRP